MTPRPRTPQLRDKRFARVRRITQTVLVGSGVASGLFIGYAASTAKPLSATTPPTTTATTPATPTTPATTPNSAGTVTPTTTPAPVATTPPVTAPITSTTTCYSTPSGTRVCY